MIATNVTSLVNTFTSNWSNWVRDYPLLELDGKWPSVGVLDLLTFSLRNTENSSEIGRQLIRASAAYLAVMAHETWGAFGAQVEVGSDRNGIFIKAHGSGKGEQSDARINIEQQLQSLLKNTPMPFPVVLEFSRNFTIEQNLLSLFGLGVVTGLTPLAEGIWLTIPEEAFKDQIDKSTIALAKQCAEYYARVFPDEQLGQVAELYLNALIYPPAHMNEDLPMTNAVNGILQFCKDYNVKNEALLKLSHNLALFPDELISQLGLTVYGALVEPPIPPEIVAVAESKGSYVGLLRSAMLNLREGLKLGEDWMQVTQFDEKEERRFEVESVLGFIPWVKIPKKRLRTKAREPRLVELIIHLAVFDLDNSARIADEILSTQPGDIEVRMQRIYIELLRNKVENAEKGFKALLSEPGCENEPLLFNLWGLCDLSRNDFHAARHHFETAYKLPISDDNLFYQVANNLCWSLILSEKYLEALDLLDKTSDRFPCPVTGLLNRSYALRLLGRADEASDIQNQLLRIYPLDRRVFGNFLLQQAAVKRMVETSSS